jgi:hypothetical protein
MRFTLCNMPANQPTRIRVVDGVRVESSVF